MMVISNGYIDQHKFFVSKSKRKDCHSKWNVQQKLNLNEKKLNKVSNNTWKK